MRGKIDIFDKETNNIIHLKTSKSRILLKPFKFHEEQLRYYMAISGSEEVQDHLPVYQKNGCYEEEEEEQKKKDDMYKLKYIQLIQYIKEGKALDDALYKASVFCQENIENLMT